MKSSLSFAKAWFAVSLLVLAFGYGFVSHAWGLFPKGFVERAWQQFYWQVQQQKGPNTWTGTSRFDRQGVRIPKPEEVQPGLTLISSSWKGPDGWDPELRLIDKNGEVLHRWRIDRAELFQEGITQRADGSGVHGTYLLSGGHIVANLEYVGTVRLDACSDVMWTLGEGNHHSIAQAEDGSFWTPVVTSTPKKKSTKYPNGYPGIEKKVWVEGVMKFDGSGSTIDEINILDLLYKSEISYKVREMLYNHSGEDITHMNDVEALSSDMSDEYPLFNSGDLLVSLLGMNLVFVFDPDSGEVKWHETDHISMQHDPDFVGNGWISVFDNGAKWADGSRAVMFKPSSDSVNVRRFSKLDFYTSVQGKHQSLNNGNVLLTETKKGRVIEVDSRGDVVWEWIHQPIDSSRVPSVTKATRVDLTREEVASWSCSSVDSVGMSAQKQQTAR